jgi:2-iminobutanoate/2-iminopropanoate deaminase
MPRNPVVSEKTATPIGPFSVAVTGQADMFMSGQVAQDPATGKLTEGDASEQARQVFRNVEAILQAAGKTLDDVLRVGLYLTDMADFADVNTVYGEVFRAPYPARTCIAVSSLPLGALVEADIVAG